MSGVRVVVSGVWMVVGGVWVKAYYLSAIRLHMGSMLA
jgi:hypothetical protein